MRSAPILAVLALALAPLGAEARPHHNGRVVYRCPSGTISLGIVCLRTGPSHAAPRASSRGSSHSSARAAAAPRPDLPDLPLTVALRPEARPTTLLAATDATEPASEDLGALALAALAANPVAPASDEAQARSALPSSVEGPTVESTPEQTATTEAAAPVAPSMSESGGENPLRLEY